MVERMSHNSDQHDIAERAEPLSLADIVREKPVRGGHWLQAQDPERYPALSDADVVAITRPLSARAARRKAAAEGLADPVAARGRRGAPHRGPPGAPATRAGGALARTF